MDSFDQYKVEKLLELTYLRQEARVKPECRDHCGPLEDQGHNGDCTTIEPGYIKLRFRIEKAKI